MFSAPDAPAGGLVRSATPATSGRLRRRSARSRKTLTTSFVERCSTACWCCSRTVMAVGNAMTVAVVASGPAMQLLRARLRRSLRGSDRGDARLRIRETGHTSWNRCAACRRSSSSTARPTRQSRFASLVVDAMNADLATQAGAPCSVGRPPAAVHDLERVAVVGVGMLVLDGKVHGRHAVRLLRVTTDAVRAASSVR